MWKISNFSRDANICIVGLDLLSNDANYVHHGRLYELSWIPVLTLGWLYKV